MRMHSVPSVIAAIRGTVALVLIAGTVAAPGVQAQAKGGEARRATALKWGPAPAVFPKGARMAVVSGDPMSSGEYVVRLSMPGKYLIAPHYHPTAEHVRVVSGTFLVGMGDAVKLKGAKRMSRGDTITAAPNMHHYAVTRGRTIVQVSGAGPFALTYVNPADLPKP